MVDAHYRGSGGTIQRAVRDRSAKSVRYGSAQTQYRTTDSGEGLWRPTRFDTAPARSVGEGGDGKAQRPARTAPADQARLRTGADLEGQELSRHGDGRWLRLRRQELCQPVRNRLGNYRHQMERSAVLWAAVSA